MRIRYQDLPENIQDDIFVNSLMLSLAIKRITDLCNWDSCEAKEYLTILASERFNKAGREEVYRYMVMLDESNDSKEVVP